MLVTKSQCGGSKQGQGNESCIILHTHLYLYLFILSFLFFLAHIYSISYFLATAFTCTDILPWFKICQYSQFDVNDGNILVWLAFLCFWVWHWVSNYTVGYDILSETFNSAYSFKQTSKKQARGENILFVTCHHSLETVNLKWCFIDESKKPLTQ